MNEPVEIVVPNEQQLERTWAPAGQRYLANTSPRRSPVAIVLAGQPGAGKSVLAEAFRDTFRDCGGAVFIDPGELLELHPAYVVLGRDDDREIVATLRPTAARLAANLLAKAVDRHRHVVLECSFDAPEAAVTLLEYLKDEGYYVAILVPAVPAETSWQDVQAHYARGCDVLPVARWTDAQFHDAVVSRLPEVLEEFERSGLADELHLISRDGRRLEALPKLEQIAQREDGSVANEGHASEGPIATKRNAVESSPSVDVPTRSLAAKPRPVRFKGFEPPEEASADRDLIVPQHGHLQHRNEIEPSRANDGSAAQLTDECHDPLDLSQYSPDEQAAIRHRIELQQVLRRYAAAERVGEA